MRTNTIVKAALVAALALPLAACGDDSGTGDGTGKLAGASLTVGSKEFTESIILGKITALALEDAGAKVTDKTGISGSATVRAALESGDIDTYWDYTGTGWVNILKHTPENVPADLYDKVAAEDLKKNKIAWLEPAPFENSYAIASTEKFSKANEITTLSQAADYAKANPKDGGICAASEFINRDDGLPGLEKTYDMKYSKVVELDFNLVYSQMGKKCTFGEATTTDGRIISEDLRILDDDKNFFVEYRGAVTMRQETLDKYPALKEILGAISKKLTNEEVTELNSKVDVEGEEPQDVAKEWLEDNDLIG
jgi:osmoprotectant transport system substrate-binding protein